MNTEQGNSDRFSIVFHQATPSQAVRARGQYLLDKLTRSFPGIMRGTMVIEGRHHHHNQGNLYHVSIRAHLPNGDVNVTHDPEHNHAHEDVYVAMRDACEAARKQLSAITRRSQAPGRRHERARFDANPRNQAQ